MLYTVIHLEDRSEYREVVERSVMRSQGTYLGLSSLTLLDHVLSQSSAKLFVVDGSFPRVEGELAELLAPEAIAAIRRYYPTTPILLFSSENDIEDIAQTCGVEYMVKTSFTKKRLDDTLRSLLR